MCAYSSCELSDEGRYLVIYISRGAEPRNKLLYSDLRQLEGGMVTSPLPVTRLVDNFDADWDVSLSLLSIGVKGWSPPNTFLFHDLWPT